MISCRERNGRNFDAVIRFPQWKHSNGGTSAHSSAHDSERNALVRLAENPVAGDSLETADSMEYGIAFARGRLLSIDFEQIGNH